MDIILDICIIMLTLCAVAITIIGILFILGVI